MVPAWLQHCHQAHETSSDNPLGTSKNSRSHVYRTRSQLNSVSFQDTSLLFDPPTQLTLAPQQIYTRALERSCKILDTQIDRATLDGQPTSKVGLTMDSRGLLKPWVIPYCKRKKSKTSRKCCGNIGSREGWKPSAGSWPI